MFEGKFPEFLQDEARFGYVTKTDCTFHDLQAIFQGVLLLVVLQTRTHDGNWPTKIGVDQCVDGELI